jgi:polysaccharide deacetylase family protein (PEP-CTERM system associated)
MNMPKADPFNALTIDVEDYFQVSAFSPYIPRTDWPIRECRIERNIDCILAMLDEHDTKATFFTLGWVAERFPNVVRRIVNNGHELASHGYGHERVSDQTPDSFFADINIAKLILEDISGTEVRGYRAPSFSIGEKTFGRLKRLKKLAITIAQYLPYPP